MGALLKSLRDNVSVTVCQQRFIIYLAIQGEPYLVQEVVAFFKPKHRYKQKHVYSFFYHHTESTNKQLLIFISFLISSKPAFFSDFRYQFHGQNFLRGNLCSCLRFVFLFLYYDQSPLEQIRFFKVISISPRISAQRSKFLCRLYSCVQKRSFDFQRRDSGNTKRLSLRIVLSLVW